MMMVRQITNRIVRGGLAHLEDAPPEAMRMAFRVLRWFAARFGADLPSELDHRLLRSVIGIVGRAVAESPYGQPLQFEHPLLVTIAVSDYCPFACTNCYSNSGGSGGGSTVTEQAPATFERLAASKTPMVLITGGEPMVSQSTRPGVQRLLDAGKVVYISTNATIDSYVADAARHPLLIFILPVWGTRARHDQMRGHRSFERVAENLRRLNEVGRKAWLLVVLSDNDLSLFDDVIDLVRTHSVAVVRITRKVQVGRLAGPASDVTPQFLRAIREQAGRLKHFVRTVVIDLPETRSGREWTRVTAALGIPRYRSCAAGNWMMHLDAGGNAYPCYTFEGRATARVAPMPSFAEQWQTVRAQRVELGDGDVCVGETLETRSLLDAAQPLRLIRRNMMDDRAVERRSA